MIVTGLMRYHIRCITQPSLVGQEPLAGGSSAADGVASTPQASGRQREGETTSATNNTDGDSDSDGAPATTRTVGAQRARCLLILLKSVINGRPSRKKTLC